MAVFNVMVNWLKKMRLHEMGWYHYTTKSVWQIKFIEKKSKASSVQTCRFGTFIAFYKLSRAKIWNGIESNEKHELIEARKLNAGIFFSTLIASYSENSSLWSLMVNGLRSKIWKKIIVILNRTKRMTSNRKKDYIFWKVKRNLLSIWYFFLKTLWYYKSIHPRDYRSPIENLISQYFGGFPSYNTREFNLEHTMKLAENRSLA